MQDHPYFFIDGAWQRPGGSGSLDVCSAATEDVIGRVPLGTPADVDHAVAAARRAFDGWAATPLDERLAWIERLAAALQARQKDLATTISREVGTPIRYSMPIQVRAAIAVLQSHIATARAYAWEETIGNSLVVREPYGVVGAITPWNYPLWQILCKLAPAMAAGCTMVLKPSEVAPLNACLLAEACLEIGLPAGVLNIVHGEGPVVGEAIASHAGVDMISFTGSVRAGRRVAALAAETITKVTLELGGKSAFVVLDDAPLEQAIPAGVNNAMRNCGQTCSAWTRMIVPRARLDDVLHLATAALSRLPLGDPLDPEARLGPLISAAQRARVEGFIRKGRDEGARIVTGGGRPAGFARGHYVEPTIFADVTSDMTIAREEIFGPVLAVLAYDTEEQAIAIANDTSYGLAGGVWSADAARAERVARRLRTGQVDINGGRYNLLAPFGGYKQSGIGRELGRFGLDEYLQVKAMAR